MPETHSDLWRDAMRRKLAPLDLEIAEMEALKRGIEEALPLRRKQRTALAALIGKGKHP